MIRNELKELLPNGWESMFKHRENWDPEGYSVASFKLKETDKRETVLAKFDKTGNIMDYFFDDKLSDYEIDLNPIVESFLGYTYKNGFILKDYSISKNGSKFKPLKDYCNDKIKTEYPILCINSKSLTIHRLIALVFVPNPYPEKYKIINHKNCDKNDFRKENLEWCDLKWNNQKENQTEATYSRLYKRLSDGKIFDRKSLSKEYPNAKTNSIVNKIVKSINKDSTYQNSKWELIDPVLNEYLSKYPLRDEWYNHPVYKNIRANACGVLEVDGKLRIGSKITGIKNYVYYRIQVNGSKISNSKTATHRILAECFFSRVIKEDEVVDHIIPIAGDNIDNSIENLQICTQKENMNNELSKQALMTSIDIYDLFGNHIKTYQSRKSFSEENKVSTSLENRLVTSGKFIVDRGLSIEQKLSYMYYKWKIDEDGNKICINAHNFLGPLYDNYNPSSGIVKKLRKYLNTGMPAPDGYYYQQGTPKEMIYDPENTKLEKKRLEIHWKDRNKE